jgi:hypothetical protein
MLGGKRDGQMIAKQLLDLPSSCRRSRSKSGGPTPLDMMMMIILQEGKSD